MLTEGCLAKGDFRTGNICFDLTALVTAGRYWCLTYDFDFIKNRMKGSFLTVFESELMNNENGKDSISRVENTGSINPGNFRLQGMVSKMVFPFGMFFKE